MSGTSLSGRRPKEVEQEMIEKLSVFTDDAYRVLGQSKFGLKECMVKLLNVKI